MVGDIHHTDTIFQLVIFQMAPLHTLHTINHLSFSTLKRSSAELAPAFWPFFFFTSSTNYPAGFFPFPSEDLTPRCFHLLKERMSVRFLSRFLLRNSSHLPSQSSAHFFWNSRWFDTRILLMHINVEIQTRCVFPGCLWRSDRISCKREEILKPKWGRNVKNVALFSNIFHTFTFFTTLKIKG